MSNLIIAGVSIIATATVAVGFMSSPGYRRGFCALTAAIGVCVMFWTLLAAFLLNLLDAPIKNAIIEMAATAFIALLMLFFASAASSEHRRSY